MTVRFFEDISVGERFQSEPYHVTEDEIVTFARQWDPQSFHVDLAVAEKSIFKGLVASGWHTAAITMRLFVQATRPPL
jgi:acyl dehydratase